ncbi:zinc finger protein 511 isoform X2 [Fundulus heteroclitus]|uniref:zinc finger protein 511 isoform X2 n=1 Tax=Fundulus heteroclitus TaxID=8078 RepID=UPI00165CC81E|nr:zinc finger protein 511 isoform X2 [Fundulus heteroclitus]
MLQPDLLQFTAAGGGGGGGGGRAHHSSEEDGFSEATEEQQEERSGQAEQRNPFTFCPQLLRLHRDHELFEDGDVLRHMYLQDLLISEAEERPAPRVSEFACHISGCRAVFSTLDEYEHHYNSLHRHVCCSCRRSLPSARLLDIHIQEWHDSLFTILAQKQDMYLCLVEGCGQKFRTSQQRKDHLIRVHKYPPDFRFDKSRKEKGDARSEQKADATMEAAGDVCRSEGACRVMCSVEPEQLEEEEESMETHVSSEEAARIEDVSASPQTSETNSGALKPKYSYRVPKTVCFGHGSVRGFRGHRGKRK